MSERWKPVPDYPGYLVSDQGRIYSEKRSRILTQHIDQSGYRRLGLYSPEGNRINVRVHVVVATAFIGPRPEGMHTRHLDGDQRSGLSGAWHAGQYPEKALPERALIRRAEHAIRERRKPEVPDMPARP